MSINNMLTDSFWSMNNQANLISLIRIFYSKELKHNKHITLLGLSYLINVNQIISLVKFKNPIWLLYNGFRNME